MDKNIKKDKVLFNPYEAADKKGKEARSRDLAFKDEEAKLVEKQLKEKYTLPKDLEKEVADKIDKPMIVHKLEADSDFREVLSKETGIPFVTLGDYAPLGDPKVLRYITSTQAKMYKAFPLKIENNQSLTVAISDPLNVGVIDNLRLSISVPVNFVCANEDDIVDMIDRYYGLGDDTISKWLEEEDKKGDENILESLIKDHDLSDLEKIANDPPVKRLVDLILIQAIKERASDIHIEPFSEMLRARYRVDGVLREIPPPPKHMQIGIVSRFKILANMDIAESRMPQDGRIKLTFQDRDIELRVSTLPTVHGESVVMRVLDKQMMMMGIEQLGFSTDVLEKFMKFLTKPNGIILATGPTGCGKTTTLYAAFNEIVDPTLKLITTEDPVEYQLDGVMQININTNVGLTFATCLRSILRHDPDIILVGEIRDIETAQIAIQASLTGHLVFSTIHTNSAASTLTRLIDMGVEPFLLTSTLQAIIGQRLVRTVCQNCKAVYAPTDDELESFKISREDIKDMTFYHGTGCPDCANTGYRGRIGVIELLPVTDEVKELILEKAATDEVHSLAVKQGMVTMRKDGLLKVFAGVTTLEEIAKHTPEEEEEIIQKVIKEVMKKEVIEVERPKTTAEYVERETATHYKPFGDADKLEDK